MAEDAGKKRFVRNFLESVRKGEDLVEWIERDICLPGTGREVSTARSSSQRDVSNVTELLRDDLKRSFDEGFFIFRLVSAEPGSGKTTLVTYLHELIKAESEYWSRSVVVRFQLYALLATGGHRTFTTKLYCYILAQTFYQLIHEKKELSTSVRSKAEQILKQVVENGQFNNLKGANDFDNEFYPKFTKYIDESGINLYKFFLSTIKKISDLEPKFTFVYVIDELDALRKDSNDSAREDTITVVRTLIKEILGHEYQSSLRLLIYLVGISDDVDRFLSSNASLDGLVRDSVINLLAGSDKEFKLLEEKMKERLKGAYSRYANFALAEHEIESIDLNPYPKRFRDFCKEYGNAVFKIHEKYFAEKDEQVFEGDARKLVEAQCRQQWESYLKKSAYKLSAVSTTKVLAGHAFDCYVELLHNGTAIARAFGEAKNYELLSGHLKTFDEWIKDINPPFNANKMPPDLAFMIAPSCPSLLQRKLELKNIQFIKSNKVAPPPLPSLQTAVNINSADKNSLLAAFRGTGVYQTTIDKLIKQRPYTDLDDLASKLRFTQKVKTKLQVKLDNGDICF